MQRAEGSEYAEEQDSFLTPSHGKGFLLSFFGACITCTSFSWIVGFKTTAWNGTMALMGGGYIK